eukprot:jgi/Chrzof1/12980/Cz07g15050.t1
MSKTASVLSLRHYLAAFLAGGSRTQPSISHSTGNLLQNRVTQQALRQHRTASRLTFRVTAAKRSRTKSILSRGMDTLLKDLSGLSPVVCYHYPCPDGVFAALASHLHFKQRGITAKYVPLNVYNAPKIEDLGLKGEEVVYLLDYAGPAGFPQEVATKAKHVVVLDHHKTSAEQLADTSTHPPNLHVLLDMNRSGATIALDFFKPAGVSDPLLEAFKYIEDADLWRWQLPNSRAFHAGMSNVKMEYDVNKNPQALSALEHINPVEVITKGQAALQYQEELIDAALKTAVTLQLGGEAGIDKGWGECLGCVVEGDLIGFRSTLGNVLAAKSQEAGLCPAGVVAYHEPDMKGEDSSSSIKVSLRSLGEYDTTTITQAYGGGGHRNASSCMMDVREFQAWRSGQPE